MESRLWLADLLSRFGSRIDVPAVPLLAASTLGASVFEVSLLRTAETLPYLVLGLPQLLFVVLGVGLLGVFFDVAHQTYVPRLAPRERLRRIETPDVRPPAAALRRAGDQRARRGVELLCSPLRKVRDLNEVSAERS